VVIFFLETDPVSFYRVTSWLNRVFLVVIFVDGNTNREMTYADIRDQSKAFGIGLKSIWEWKKGDVLALFRCVALSAA